jgi:putative oxidoreductase
MFATSPAATAQRISIGLAILRVVIGIVFIAHGAQKFFVFGIDGATAAFGQMGVPFPALTAPLTAAVEILAGSALIIGLLTRLAALGLAINMLGAILLVRAQGGFFAPKGMEFELTLFAAALALAFTGAGRYSVDAVLAERSPNRTAAP